MGNLRIPLYILFSGITQSLDRAAYGRLSDAWAPSTLKSHTQMFRLFLSFTIFADVPVAQVKIVHVLAFLECLKMNGVKASQMQNYVSAVKSFYVKFSLSFEVWDHPQIAMFIKAVQKTARFSVCLPNLVDIDLFKTIMTKCDSIYMGKIFKVAYCLGFFGFLRLSNLVPHNVNSFSFLKHLCKGDIFFKQTEATVLMKWTKTMQSNNKARLLKIPVLNNNFCPVKALKDCLQIVPGGNNAPLLQFT